MSQIPIDTPERLEQIETYAETLRSSMGNPTYEGLLIKALVAALRRAWDALAKRGSP